MPPRIQSGPVGIVNTRPRGTGHQFEVQHADQQETTWENASLMRKRFPQLVAAFEAAARERSRVDPPRPEGGAGVEEEKEAGQVEGDEVMSLRRQLAEQRELLMALQAAPVSTSAPSRFARKEPRAQDLREYDGAAGNKLDEWLQELALATLLYELNAHESSMFG